MRAYARTALTAGILHLGSGGFHRARQAMYVDRLMSAGQAYDWAICGVGVLPGDARMKQVVDSQCRLHTLMAKNPDGEVKDESSSNCSPPMTAKPSSK